jgi:glycosyltransferase involved in cell wall biosynthesis
MMKLSVVIPTFNESRRLAKTLEAITGFLGDDRTYEIIIADDGSRDDTLNLVRQLARRWPQIVTLPSEQGNVGKGDAVKRGVLKSQGELVLMTDADNAVPISELTKLQVWMTQYPIVVGSKYAPGATSVGGGGGRKLLSYFGHLAVVWLAVPDVRDTQCGFKLFQGVAAREIFKRVTIKRFGFDIEIFVIARALGLPYKEVGIHWSSDSDSRVRPWRDALSTIGELLMITRNRRQGRYVK